MMRYSFDVEGVDQAADPSEYEFTDDRSALTEGVRLLMELVHDRPSLIADGTAVQVAVAREGRHVGTLHVGCDLRR